ncbi:MAG: hypothetical protein H0T56_06920 [Pseudaminobacter sp.]|nr:hypothetical protein [Pseudaminobacter sp.]
MAAERAGDNANISRTTGSDSAHERRKANPDAEDMTDPKEVWKNAETTPSADPAGNIPRGRVADAGDLMGGAPSPYSTETQADALAKQTDRENEPGNIEKPDQ